MPRKRGFTDAIDRRISARVNEAKLLAGWSNQMLGDRIGVTHQQASKYCNGTNRITGGTLSAIAKVLKLPITYFFEGDDGVDDTKTTYLKLFKNFAKLPKKQQELIARMVENITKITKGENND